MSHFHIPNKLANRERLLLKLCEGRSVLHLGCADSPFTEQSLASGMWLHSRISKIAGYCVGVDLDREAVRLLRQQYGIKNLVEGDAERLNELGLDKFEVILGARSSSI